MSRVRKTIGVFPKMPFGELTEFIDKTMSVTKALIG